MLQDNNNEQIRSSQSMSTGSNMSEMESVTYYYSKFDLFDESQDFYFLKYQIFKTRLYMALGKSWIQYAGMSIFQIDTQTGQLMYLDSSKVFDLSLDVWLELRKEIGFRIHNIDMQENMDPFQENAFFAEFQDKFQQKIHQYQVDNQCATPVQRGFFTSAYKIWLQTIQGQDQSTMNIISDLNQSTLNQIKDTLHNYAQKQPIIKPLVIATEKFIEQSENIIKYFNTSKKEKITEEIYQRTRKESIQELDENDAKNFNNFQTNVLNEVTQELKQQMENLNINDEEKMNRKRKNQESYIPTKFIQLSKFTMKSEKIISPYYLDKACEFIENFMQKQQEKWQVARGFVTNIVEVNYNQLTQLDSNFSYTNINNQIKLRFLQPANEFYNHLMKTFIILKTKNYSADIKFSEFLDQIKQSMSQFWNNRFDTPTHIFFKTLQKVWNNLLDVSINNQELQFKLFIQKVKIKLLKIWDEDIVQKMEFLNHNKIQTNTE